MGWWRGTAAVRRAESTDGEGPAGEHASHSTSSPTKRAHQQRRHGREQQTRLTLQTPGRSATAPPRDRSARAHDNGSTANQRHLHTRALLTPPLTLPSPLLRWWESVPSPLAVLALRRGGARAGPGRDRTPAPTVAAAAEGGQGPPEIPIAGALPRWHAGRSPSETVSAATSSPWPAGAVPPQARRDRLAATPGNFRATCQRSDVPKKCAKKVARETHVMIACLVAACSSL